MTKSDRFPGVEQCLKMMRHGRGSVSEEGFGWLERRAATYLPQLIAAFWDEENVGIRDWLVELIGDAASPDAISFLIERLHDNDQFVRDMAAYGLRRSNTKEARRALWQAGLKAEGHD